MIRIRLSRSPGRPWAFTLIELLVVIAIIGILASILFPVFARARGKGLQTQCLSNMKQLGYAIFLYRQDYNGTWVPGSLPDSSPKPPNASGWQPWKAWIGYDNSPQTEPPGAGWTGDQGDMTLPAHNPIHPGMIDVYVKSSEVKRCPTTPNKAQMIYAVNGWDPYWGGVGGYPGEFGPFGKTADYGFGTNAQGLPIKAAGSSDVEEESNTLIMWEHWNRVPWCQFTEDVHWLDQPPEDQRYHFSWLHYDGANTLWADGHAKRMIFDQLRRWMFGCHKHIYPNYGG